MASVLEVTVAVERAGKPGKDKDKGAPPLTPEERADAKGSNLEIERLAWTGRIVIQNGEAWMEGFDATSFQIVKRPTHVWVLGSGIDIDVPVAGIPSEFERLAVQVEADAPPPPAQP